MGRTSRVRRQAAATATVLACLILVSAASCAARADAQDDQAEARRIAAKQLEQYGEGYKAHFDDGRRILYVSALDEGHLKQTMRRLSGFAEAYRRTMPGNHGHGIVTVVLPTAQDYKKTRLPYAGGVGFYSFADRRLVSIDRGRTLVHEFTHALHHADMAAARQVHPLWVCEGLATLFEAAAITPQGLVPHIDTRLITLQKAIREKKTFALSELLSMGRKPFMKDAAVAYAQSRYVMVYLYEQGRLDDFYGRYKKTFASDPHGIAALEWALGAKLPSIERKWRKWVEEKKLPMGERRSQRGRLGLEVKRASRGAEVVGIEDGSAADTAGRIHVGDVIEQFNGQAIRNAAELVAAIRAAGAKKTVEVQIRRGGRKLTIRQPLG